MVGLVGTLAYGPVSHLFIPQEGGMHGMVMARLPPRPTEASSLSSALAGMNKLGSAVQKADSAVEAEAKGTERLRLIKEKHEAEMALTEVVAEATQLKTERGENLFKARLAKDEATAKAADLQARQAHIRLMRDRRKLSASHFKAMSSKRAQGALKGPGEKKSLHDDTIMFVQEILPDVTDKALMSASEIRDASSKAIEKVYGKEGVGQAPSVKTDAEDHGGEFLEEPAEFGPWLMI